MKRPLLGCAFLLLALTHLVNAGFVPFRLVGHIVMVECRLDGNDMPLNFMVDTGGRTFVDPQVARKLGLKTKGFGVKIRRLAMGDIEIENVFGMMVFDFTPWEKFGIHLSGMIGSDLLERFTVTFDYAARKIEFSKARQLDPAVPGLRQNFTTHPINNAPMVPIRIGDMPEMQAMIDTGQPMDLVIPLSMWERIRPGGNVIRARGVLLKWPMTRSRENRLTRLEGVRVGPLSPTAMPVFWAELPAQLSVPLLGRSFLSRYRVTLCYPAREARFQPIGENTPDAAFSTFGFYLYWDGESGHARVRGIWEQSPAERAGLAPEDIVFSICGKNLEHAVFPDMLNRLEEPGRTTLELEVERNGSRRKLRLQRGPLFPRPSPATDT